MKRVLAICLLLALIPASGHGAPPSKDQDIRLLHDCNDDYHGSDAGIGGREGYDLHTLDIREIYTNGANALVFRIILNGDGPADIDVNFKVSGDAKTYTFAKANSWTSTFDKLTLPSDIDDGERFAIEGTVAWANIGAKVGSKISEYNAIGTYADGSDSLRDFDGPALSACDEETVFFPDANQDKIPDSYPLRGPVQFFSTAIREPDVTFKVGERKLIEIQVGNKIQSSQNVELRASNGAMVDVEFHNIDSDVYEEVGRIGLGAKGTISGTKVLHLVVEGNTVGAGTIEVITTSTLGGRVVKTLDYEVTSTSSSSTQPSSSESEQSPGAGIGLALIGLAFLARRK
jgi:hypothetical protein